MNHDKWDWSDQEYVQEYACNHTRMYFQYSDFIDPVGMGTWTEKRKYMMQCKLTGFANDKIRVFYKMNGTIGATQPVFSNDSPEGNGK